MKFDGTKWDYVGEQNLNGGSVKYISLDTDSKETPYVIYLEMGVAPGGVAIQVFQDNATEDNVAGWGFVGEDRLMTTAGAAYTTVYLSSDDELYASYIDTRSSANEGHIKKFTLNK